MKKVFNRQQLKDVGPQPTTLADTIYRLECLKQRCTAGEVDLPFGSNLIRKINGNVVMFATDDSLSLMNRTNVILGDGTFAVSPRKFTQMYTIHACLDNNYGPIAHFLLVDKKQKTYTKMIEMFLEETTGSVETIVLDFETGAINAFQSLTP